MNSEQMYDVLEQNRATLGKSYEVMLIMFRGGFRVSEVLKMNYSNILNDTDVYIVASKNSRSKSVHVPEISRNLKKYKTFKMTPYSGISRFQMYRACKRLGLVIDNGINKNKSVTHSMRKVFVQGILKSTNNIDVAAELVGHKSTKSTEYYAKKTKN
ncbi:MAG: site-specific integrase [Pseudomonadota bacterium]